MTRAGQIERRGTFGTRFLIVGFASMLLLSVLTLGLAAIEFSRVEQSALDTADDSYAIYNLANVGEDLARLQALVALSSSESPDELGRHSEQIAELESHLQAAAKDVPATLDPVSRTRWAALWPQIEHVQRVYADAVAAIRRGEPPRAAKLLAGVAPATTPLHGAIDELEQAHREAVLAELRSAHDNASSMVVVEIVLAGAFLVGMIGIFTIQLRMIRRQGQRLADYTARLEQANADLDAFAGRVAHDLRNALGPIAMAPALLRGSPADLPLVLKMADRTERSSRRAIAIIDALLAFSRAARVVGKDESGAVRSAWRNVLDELAPLAAQLEASIEVEDLPDVHVRCSPGLLHIVLANLCGNAIKYLEGRPERRVRISAQVESSAAAGDECRIEVEDTGPGIPSEAQAKIFEPFYRVEGSRVPGSGIGLATVRRILEARGGRVTVESEVGRGARFQVWLPLVPSPPPASSEPQPPIR